MNEGEEALSYEEVMNFLDERHNKIEAVCITGGEPTLMPDLEEKIRDNFSTYLQVGDRVLHIEKIDTGYSGEHKETLDFSIDIIFYENTYVKNMDDPIEDVYFRIKKKED